MKEKEMNAEFSFKPLQNGAVLRRGDNQFHFVDQLEVSNPFKTGRYCVGAEHDPDRNQHARFQTPSKRGGTA